MGRGLADVAMWPALLTRSVEKRLRPRYKLLLEAGKAEKYGLGYMFGCKDVDFEKRFGLKLPKNRGEEEEGSKEGEAEKKDGEEGKKGKEEGEEVEELLVVKAVGEEGEGLLVVKAVVEEGEEEGVVVVVKGIGTGAEEEDEEGNEGKKGEEEEEGEEVEEEEQEGRKQEEQVGGGGEVRGGGGGWGGRGGKGAAGGGGVGEEDGEFTVRLYSTMGLDLSRGAVLRLWEHTLVVCCFEHYSVETGGGFSEQLWMLVRVEG
ncbi:unnamed protein product [Closterium sp. NIES-65]|nr:unnamed protein product [Closterium sp. NIES-65]